jgi:hypothetical protein
MGGHYSPAAGRCQSAALDWALRGLYDARRVMKVSLALADETMPRTIFYDRFLSAVSRNTRFTEDEAQADVLIPAEDIALEQNWPRYGEWQTAFVRGQRDDDRYKKYLIRLSEDPRRLCLVNMLPLVRAPQIFREKANLIIADISLAMWERAINPRTISMPALPINVGRCSSGTRDVMVSFRGANSYAGRAALAAIHDGSTCICELVDRQNHIGAADATAGRTDPRYAQLLERSVFALVPGGDALFSYRLLEALTFGCIPIVLSDGWVLPFDRSIEWNTAVVIMPEASVQGIPKLVRLFTPQRIAQMQATVNRVYLEKFASMDLIVESLLRELEIVLASYG